MTEKTVVNCCDFFGRIWPECSLFDLTDGMYLGNPDTSYKQAQENQINWLLDQVGCKDGSRILDIGCGYEILGTSLTS